MGWSWCGALVFVALLGSSGCAIARVERPVRRAALPVAALKDEPVRIAVSGPGVDEARVTVERLHLDVTALAWVRPDGTSVEVPYSTIDRVEVSSPTWRYALVGGLAGAAVGSGVTAGISAALGAALGPDGGMLGGLAGIIGAAVGGVVFGIVGGAVGAAIAPIDVDVDVAADPRITALRVTVPTSP